MAHVLSRSSEGDRRKFANLVFSSSFAAPSVKATKSLSIFFWNLPLLNSLTLPIKVAAEAASFTGAAALELTSIISPANLKKSSSMNEQYQVFYFGDKRDIPATGRIQYVYLDAR